MDLEPLIPLILGALLAFAAGVAGAALQARREHHRWQRERRLDAYIAAITVLDRNVHTRVAFRASGNYLHDQSEAGDRARALHADAREAMASASYAMAESLAAVQIVGPDGVVKAINAEMEAFREERDEDRPGTLREMRKALNLSGKGPRRTSW